MKKFVSWLFVAVILFALGFLICYKCVKEPLFREIKTVTDTTTYYDTSFFAGPKLSELIVNTRPLDTLWLPSEPKYIHDTTYFPVPMEQVVYQDSSYRAVVSGFRPKLDSLEIYRKTILIETTKTVMVEPSRWAVSVHGGYGITPKGLTPYIGVGISYNLYTFKQRK